MTVNRTVSQNARAELDLPFRSSGTDRVTSVEVGSPPESGSHVATRRMVPVRSQRLFSSSSVVAKSRLTAASSASRVSSWPLLLSVPESPGLWSNCQSMGPGASGGPSQVVATVIDPHRGGLSSHPEVALTAVSLGTSMSALAMLTCLLPGQIRLSWASKSRVAGRVTSPAWRLPPIRESHVATRRMVPVRSQRLFSSSSVVAKSRLTAASSASRVSSWPLLLSVPESPGLWSNCQSMGPGASGGPSQVVATVTDPHRGGSSTHPAAPLIGCWGTLTAVLATVTWLSVQESNESPPVWVASSLSMLTRTDSSTGGCVDPPGGCQPTVTLTVPSMLGRLSFGSCSLSRLKIKGSSPGCRVGIALGIGDHSSPGTVAEDQLTSTVAVPSKGGMTVQSSRATIWPGKLPDTLVIVLGPSQSSRGALSDVTSTSKPTCTWAGNFTSVAGNRFVANSGSRKPSKFWTDSDVSMFGLGR